MRAKVHQATQAAQPLQAEIAGFLASEGRCPANGEGGIGEPAAYASAPVASIVTGALEDSGRCAIELTLGGTGAPALEGKRVWLEYEPADGSWGCSSELEDRYLPAACRE